MQLVGEHGERPRVRNWSVSSNNQNTNAMLNRKLTSLNICRCQLTRGRQKGTNSEGKATYGIDLKGVVGFFDNLAKNR